VNEHRKNYNKYPTMPFFYGYATAQFIAATYQKAGTVDKEEFIDALEGYGTGNKLGLGEGNHC
jgi:hypothetical protein